MTHHGRPIRGTDPKTRPEPWQESWRQTIPEFGVLLGLPPCHNNEWHTRGPCRNLEKSWKEPWALDYGPFLAHSHGPPLFHLHRAKAKADRREQLRRLQSIVAVPCSRVLSTIAALLFFHWWSWSQNFPHFVCDGVMRVRFCLGPEALRQRLFGTFEGPRCGGVVKSRVGPRSSCCELWQLATCHVWFPQVRHLPRSCP